MFIKKFAESDFIDSIEINLKNLESQDQLSEAQCLDQAITFIRLSADLLDEIGMDDKASELTEMLESLANADHEKSESEHEEHEKHEEHEEHEHEHEHDEEEDDDEEEIVVEEEDDKEDEHKADDSFAKDFLKKKKKTKEDKATKGLTSKKMTENLKHKGWVFNAKDGCCPECGGDLDSPMDAKDSDKYVCQYCGESMDDDKVFCSQYCMGQANDCGMIYDCMDSWDSNDAPKCSGWKKAPVGSPKQRAFCKRHCGMKKKLTSKKVADDPDSCINQGLRRWKCRCS